MRQIMYVVVVAVMMTMTVSVVEVEGRNRKILQTPSSTLPADEVPMTFHDPALEKFISLVEEQSESMPTVTQGPVPTKPVSSESNTAAEYFKKYEPFMHAYVDDLTARMVKMQFAAISGDKDPWMPNFKDFLSDESLHKLLKSGPAPPWIASQKVALDMWRKKGKDVPIQTILMHEFQKKDIKEILLSTGDPLMKMIFNSKNEEQFKSWAKMMNNFMSTSEATNNLLKMITASTGDMD